MPLKKSIETPLSSFVCGLDPFRGLTEAQRQGVLFQARLRVVPEGRPIFAQVASALRFFFLISGRLKIVQTSPEGQQIIAHWVEPGQFFGLAVAIGRPDYPGGAVAVAESSILEWPSAAWPGLVVLYPDVGGAALRTVGGHLQDAFARLRDVAGTRVDQRVARALLRLVRQSGRPTKDGVEIGFPITRQEIAEITNTTLFTVSRTLSVWEKAGLLKGRRRRIEILDTEALARVAAEDRAGPE